MDTHLKKAGKQARFEEGTRCLKCREYFHEHELCSGGICKSCVLETMEDSKTTEDSQTTEARTEYISPDGIAVELCKNHDLTPELCEITWNGEAPTIREELEGTYIETHDIELETLYGSVEKRLYESTGWEIKQVRPLIPTGWI